VGKGLEAVGCMLTAEVCCNEEWGWGSGGSWVTRADVVVGDGPGAAGCAGKQGSPSSSKTFIFGPLGAAPL